METVMEKKRYAHVGIGGRARMYYEAIAKTYSETSELVAFCDINRTRMEYANNILENELGYHKVPMYGTDDDNRNKARFRYSNLYRPHTPQIYN